MIAKWLRLRRAGVPMGFGDVAGAALRRALTDDLVAALILAQEKGLLLDRSLLEAHALAGGNVLAVVEAAALLDSCGEPYPLDLLSATDIKGHPLLELADSYSAVRSRYPHFRFEDMLRRHLAGEDVIAAARDGTLMPA